MNKYCKYGCDPSVCPASLALICQSCVETCADLSGVTVQKDTCVIHEKFLYSRIQRTNECVLIDAADLWQVDQLVVILWTTTK